MNYNILSTAKFSKEAKRLSKKYISIKFELNELISLLETEPEIGQSLGKNCFKIRLAVKSKGKGKSGGARVITLVKIINEEVHLLSIYDKSEKENISEKDLTKFIENTL